MNARRPVRASRARMEVRDALEQPRIFDRPSRRRAFHVRVVATRGDTEHPTKRPHGIVGRMRSNELSTLGRNRIGLTREPGCGFLGTSFSSLSFLFSRRKRASAH